MPSRSANRTAARARGRAPYRPWPLPGGGRCAAGLCAPALLAGCAGTGALEQPATLGGLLLALGAAVVLNTGLVAALLLVWERRTRTRRLCETLRRELRHLCAWAGDEGVARKTALLRDLEALGAVPPSLEGCELAGADLRGLRLAGCALRGANLAGADLQGAVLDGVDFFGAVLADANLALASLRGANLRGANLERASLVKADLREANLHRAELVGTDLQGAALADARLDLARFAHPQPGAFQLPLHVSVEDWIRARLDDEGRYREEAPPEDRALHEAG